MYSVADIPGLIEGSYEDAGLGTDFLRHIERCRCLFFVLDAASDFPMNDQLRMLRHQLESYQPGLSDRANLIVANKIDLPHARDNVKLFTESQNQQIFPVSAATGEGITLMLKRFRQIYDQQLSNDDL